MLKMLFLIDIRVSLSGEAAPKNIYNLELQSNFVYGTSRVVKDFLNFK